MNTVLVASVALLAVVHTVTADNPELPIPVNECPHWFDIRTDYVAEHFVNEKYQASIFILCELCHIW